MLAFFEEMLKNQQEFLVDLFSVSLFLIVIIFVALFARFIKRREDIKKRAYAPSMAFGGEDSYDRRLPRSADTLSVSKFFANIASGFVPEDENSTLSALRGDLIRAGFFDRSALAWYYFSRVILSLAFPAIGMVVLTFTRFGLEQSTWITVAILILLALIGMLLPSLYLARRKSKLEAEYRDGFPEVMDLLVVCTEAGIGFSAAINRVTNEIAKTHRYLGVNLHLMTLELRAGRALAEAFDSLAERVSIDEVRNLGSLLKQSEALGTSLNEALRTYSDEMREKRFFKAEEKAYALPAKMVIPLGLFIFPVMMVIIMLPLAIRISGAFSS